MDEKTGRKQSNKCLMMEMQGTKGAERRGTQHNVGGGGGALEKAFKRK